MLEANKTITLFNKYRDYDKNERWLKTVICGVSWFFSKSIIVSKEGKTEREVCTIRIPNSAKSEGKVYIDSKSFAKGKREKHWTVSVSYTHLRAHET